MSRTIDSENRGDAVAASAGGAPPARRRAGRLDVRTLEADIIDVEAQVHDLLVQMQVGVVAIERQVRCQLDHTDQHQRRHFTGGAGHGIAQPRTG